MFELNWPFLKQILFSKKQAQVLKTMRVGLEAHNIIESILTAVYSNKI